MNIDGDSSETALLRFVEKHVDSSALRAKFPSQNGGSIPFTSAIKFQVSVHYVPNVSRWLLLLKGAPERVLSKCGYYLEKGEVRPMDDKFRNLFDEAYMNMGGMGERVLGFSERWLPEKEFPPTFDWDTVDDAFVFLEPFFMEKLTFVGLFSLIDPPRPSVPPAIAACQSAGIKVIMVTGDHPITATAIARKVGIIRGETVQECAKRLSIKADEVPHLSVDGIVINGNDLKEMTQEQLLHCLEYPEVVFARTSPQQKLMIVEACQKTGHVVAVTGDGVNDAPALKQADIGIAMGIPGSEVSKEAAKLILLDDNFASIVAGIKEGRLLFHNLKKSIAYEMTHKFPEIFPFFLMVFLLIPNMLSTILKLTVDLLIDLIPSIALAYEDAERGIMKLRPRNNNTDRLINWRLLFYSYLIIGVLEFVACMFAFMVVMNDYGIAPTELIGQAQAFLPGASDTEIAFGDLVTNYHLRRQLISHGQTVFYITLVFCQMCNLVCCKTRVSSIFRQGMSNLLLDFSMFWQLCVVLVLVYFPIVQVVFETANVRFVHWLLWIPFGLLILGFEEARKVLMRKKWVLSRWLRTYTLY